MCGLKYSHLTVICGDAWPSNIPKTMKFAAPEGRPGGDSETTQYFLKDLGIYKSIKNSEMA
jgi:hypothetical protein